MALGSLVLPLSRSPALPHRGTTVEAWSTAASLKSCGLTTKSPPRTFLYNGMIRPYTVGPMALTGFTWYQGESNTAQDANSNGQNDGPSHCKHLDACPGRSNLGPALPQPVLGRVALAHSPTRLRASHPLSRADGCRFVAMIEAWRAAFQSPTAWFGFVQLSTWCRNKPEIPKMRQIQMEAFHKLENVGFATNADHGGGCGIHPPSKQFVGRRLGNSALGQVYKQGSVLWESPAATAFAFKPGSAVVTVGSAVSAAGLTDDVYPFNYLGVHKESRTGTLMPLFNCSDVHTDGNDTSAVCAWAALRRPDGSWGNATIAVTAPAELTVTLVAGGGGTPTAVAYGWGPVPMLNVYDKASGLPLLPFNSSFSAAPPGDRGPSHK